MKKVNSNEAPAAIGPYSHAYITMSGLVFTSGQIPANPDGSPMARGIEAQAEQSCRNVGAVLKAAGTDYDHVIKTTCFLADMADFAAFNKVYEKYFISKPARSCVAVKTLPAGALCEIEAIAEL
jgi:reactive intermediate/imine deaminase